MNNLDFWAEIQDISWVSVLNNTINLGSHYKVVPTEGYLAWEYNPLRNYRLSENMYEKDGKYYSEADVKTALKAICNKDVIFYYTEDIIHRINEIIANFLYYDEFKDIPKPEPLDQVLHLNQPFTEEYICIYYGVKVYNEFMSYTLREPGELVDFVTNELSFNLQHPVEILPLYSYDGSVNLILNDGLNIPRLINSRFTVTGKNTYKVIDRKGDNDTNIYDLGTLFDTDTSLFKSVNKIPKLEYLGTANGNMKIGNYHFYFKYADADGNESDWVAESGLVSVFMGNNPQSVNTGIRDENSVKSVRFRLTNIDISYAYVKVYYTRYTADIDANFVVSAKRVEKNFLVNNSGTCLILLNGDEDETEVTLEEINSSFDVIQSAQTQCSAANRLFMANIHKSKIEYDMLAKLSLCFCPYKTEEIYPLTLDGMDENYNISARSDGYYDTLYIYDKTGYWPGELYRIGVVYILKDGSLSPVFNIRGASNIPTLYNLNTKERNCIYRVDLDFYTSNPKKNLDQILAEIDYSEEDFMIIGGKAENENAKGVIQLSEDYFDVDTTFPVVGLKITANNQVINRLKDYAKGFFFVRQKRMPITMCLGLVIGLDNKSRTPTLPTLGGVVSNIEVNKSYVETDLNDINFVTEGFLSRYYYKLVPKPTSFWSMLFKALAVFVVLAIAAVATIFTAGAAGIGFGAGLATMLAGGAFTVGATIGTIGAVAGVAFVATGIGVGISAIALKVRLKRNKGKANRVKGRHEEIPDGYERKELDDSRKLDHSLQERYIIKEASKNSPDAIIVPDYQVNMPYYNLFLTGNDFTVKLIHELPIYNYLTDGYLDSELRHFYATFYKTQSDTRSYYVKLVGVPDGCPAKIIGETEFRARAGYPEEAHRYEFVGETYDDSENRKANSDIVRGNFGSYVGMFGYKGHACDLVKIMIPGYKENELFNYMLIRMLDTSAFFAISDRIDIHEINKHNTVLLLAFKEELDFEETYFRGDCYICQYSHRIIRNFNDPSAPYNDTIVDEKSWRDNYDPDKTEDYAKINLGDVNAILLGLWLTFRLRSSYNLNIRTVDKSNVDEHLMCGNYRSFYPNYGQVASGNLKIPDSALYNKGFTKSVSEKYYFEVPDVPYIKLEFANRIIFSDIHVNDAYKNGFRVIRSMNHKDYPMTYGSITKLIEMKNALLVVFEHGIGLISINNSAEHSSQILSDLNVISDMYGSLWKDSVIKTPSGVYGVDTVAKKIWRIKSGEIELISDFKVLEFLNQNISLSERETTPILGVRNVKTVYNAFKHDVMFTFYDNLYGQHEHSWNLCWNEILGIFTTFYSWIPCEMLNIDNIPFSFDRDTVKAIGKLGVSDHGNDYSDGVTLSNNVITVKKQPPKRDSNGEEVYLKPTFEVANKDLSIKFMNKLGEYEEYEFLTEIPTDELEAAYYSNKDLKILKDVISDEHFIGFLHLDKRVLPDGKSKYHIKYLLLKDRQGNHKIFNIKEVDLAVKRVNEIVKSDVVSVKVCYLSLNDSVYVSDLLSEIYYRNSRNIAYADSDIYKIAPEPSMYSASSLKLPGTRILNKVVLDELKTKYGENWPVGYDTSGGSNSDKALHCGFIKDVYKQCQFAEIPEDQDPKTYLDEDTKYHGINLSQHFLIEATNTYNIWTDLPVFKNKAGKRLMLPRHLQVNPDKIVRYLNIKANVFIESLDVIPSASEAYFNLFANGDHNVCMIDAGYFESLVAITTSFNLGLLSTDFWKHGLAGIIDISDQIYPTYWYGKQHPFEFECIVVDDPSVHKIFTNLELIANKVKPESFHYEVVGDTYDFAEDKPTMYFRQEALKALYQYNGYDIEYNPNFLTIEPKQHNKSADLPKYYSRWDGINDIYDSYKRFQAPLGFNYDHLAGAEIVYYPTRNEFRVWNHVEAIDVDSKVMDKKKGMEVETSIIKANCRYLEDKWLVSINPIIVTYKNEIDKSSVPSGESMFSKNALGVYKYSTWVNAYNSSAKLPPINIQGTKLAEKLSNTIEFPGELTQKEWEALDDIDKANYTLSDKGKDNALYGLYDLTAWRQGNWRPIDPTKNKDRRETDVRGKFVKVRIRYSGEELAIIDFLNTIYQISFA